VGVGSMGEETRCPFDYGDQQVYEGGGRIKEGLRWGGQKARPKVKAMRQQRYMEKGTGRGAWCRATSAGDSEGGESKAYRGQKIAEWPGSGSGWAFRRQEIPSRGTTPQEGKAIRKDATTKI